MPRRHSGSSSQVQVNRRTDSTPSKLRESCYTCAMSKVKCAKEKPTCSRCSKRGVTCEYLATKRPGRKRDDSKSTQSNSNGSISNAVGLPTLNGDDTRSNTASPTTHAVSSGNNSYMSPLDLGPTPQTPSNASGAGYSISSDIFSSLLMPIEPSMSPTLMATSNEIYSPEIDFLHLDTLYPSLFIQECNDISKLLIPDSTDELPALEMTSVGHLRENRPYPSMSSQAPMISTSGLGSSPDRTCDCLTRCLDLMKDLYSTNSLSSLASKSLDESQVTSCTEQNSNPSRDTIAMENKLTIEAVISMVRCSCQDDGYILTMMSMIVLKVLGRYASAAQEQLWETTEGGQVSNTRSLGREDRRQTTNRYPDDKYARRVAVQSILGELHLVQQLVNQLSLRPKAVGVEPTCQEGGILHVKMDADSSQTASLQDSEKIVGCFSPTTLNQIETDMRKRLNMLSSSIISTLREM